MRAEDLRECPIANYALGRVAAILPHTEKTRRIPQTKGHGLALMQCYINILYLCHAW